MTGYNFAVNAVHDKKSNYYSIITLNIPDRRVYIKSYSSEKSQEASDEYAKIEQETRNDVAKDAVLVSAGDLKNLKKTYPNYFLDINKFARRLEAIISAVDKIE